MKAQKILDNLHLLNAEQRKQAISKLRFLDASGESSSKDMDARLRESLYGQLSKVLKEHAMSPAPYGVFLKSREAPRYKRDVPSLIDFIQSGFGTKDEIQVLHGAGLCFRCLVNWMNRFQIPVSSSSCLRNVRNIPSAVEDCYPGYAAGGKLSIILRMPTKPEQARCRD